MRCLVNFYSVVLTKIYYVGGAWFIIMIILVNGAWHFTKHTSILGYIILADF